jgi:NAD(P)-dependent dehydrogenase (short-subunit alcohol dehydrogenase family)
LINREYWKGKTVLITGASSGIGEAIFTLLSGTVAKAYILSRDPKPISEIGIPNVKQDKGLERANKGITQIISINCDLSQSNQVEKAIEQILKEEKKEIDVIFNNAGITAHGRFDSTKMEVFRQTFEINFFGPIRLIQGLLSLLKPNKGIVISTSTVSALYGVPGRSAYSSSKSALHAVMEAFRIEMSEFGIRSILVCPPYTKTKLRTSGLDADGSILSEEQASGKIKTPEEVAEKILEAVENKKSRLVTIDKSGFAMKVLRLFNPALLERILFKKLYKDFH